MRLVSPCKTRLRGFFDSRQMVSCWAGSSIFFSALALASFVAWVSSVTVSREPVT